MMRGRHATTLSNSRMTCLLDQTRGPGKVVARGEPTLHVHLREGCARRGTGCAHRGTGRTHPACGAGRQGASGGPPGPLQSTWVPAPAACSHSAPEPNPCNPSSFMLTKSYLPPIPPVVQEAPPRHCAMNKESSSHHVRPSSPEDDPPAPPLFPDESPQHSSIDCLQNYREQAACGLRRGQDRRGHAAVLQTSSGTLGKAP